MRVLYACVNIIVLTLGHGYRMSEFAGIAVQASSRLGPVAAYRKITLLVPSVYGCLLGLGVFLPGLLLSLA